MTICDNIETTELIEDDANLRARQAALRAARDEIHHRIEELHRQRRARCSCEVEIELHDKLEEDTQLFDEIWDNENARLAMR